MTLDVLIYLYLQVHHDMSSPLAHYFLYTGHNSYLTGNQLSSESSTTPIINALKKGVRVIELDLWPNSREDDVEVRHGGYRFSLKYHICAELHKVHMHITQTNGLIF